METLNNFLIYALQSPKKRHNLYVGQTDNYKRRMKQHKSEGGGCRYIRRAIKKYGWKNMKRFVFLGGLTKEQADWYEQHYIKIFDCQAPRGMNLTSGGDGSSPCQITRDKMSASGKALGDSHPTKRLDVRAKISATHSAKGDNHHTKRLDVRAKISAAGMGNQRVLGYKHTDEFKVKKSESAKVLMNKHENRERTRLTTQLQYHEKRLEKEGYFD